MNPLRIDFLHALCLMICNRNVLSKDIVSSVLDASVFPNPSLSPSQHSISISQCLRIERYRGLDNPPRSRTERLLQPCRSAADISAHGSTGLPPSLNYLKPRPAPICTSPTQWRERRFISRPSRPPARQGAGRPLRSVAQGASNGLLRGSSDGVGTLDGLAFEEGEQK